MDICFSNNAVNTNTQQSPLLVNFLLKQIKANSHKAEGYKNHFSSQYEHTLMKKTINTQNLKGYLRYTSLSHHEHIFKKKEQSCSITKEISDVCTKQKNTLHSLQL
jgi:hypothetical protein